MTECILCQLPTPLTKIALGWDFEYNTTREEFTLKRCSQCGLTILDPLPPPEKMSEIYPSHYYSFGETEHQSKLVRKVRDKLELKKIRRLHLLLSHQSSAAVLDIGCGDGRLLDLFRSHNRAFWDLKGIEMGHEGSERARQKGYETKQGDFEALDLSSWNGKFDLILMHQILEHTRSPIQVIQNVSTLLKPNGLFSIETPDTESWDSSLFGQRYWGGYHIPRHFYLFNKKSLKKILDQTGFTILSIKSILSPVFWILSLHNLLVEKYRFDSPLARFFHYQNPILLTLATLIDFIQIKLFKQSSNMQILCQKKVN